MRTIFFNTDVRRCIERRSVTEITTARMRRTGGRQYFQFVCQSTPVGIPQYQVLSQVFGPRSFPGGIPIPRPFLGSTPDLAGEYPRTWVPLARTGVPPSQDWGTPPGQITLWAVCLVRFSGLSFYTTEVAGRLDIFSLENILLLKIDLSQTVPCVCVTCMRVYSSHLAKWVMLWMCMSRKPVYNIALHPTDALHIFNISLCIEVLFSISEEWFPNLHKFAPNINAQKNSVLCNCRQPNRTRKTRR